MLNKTSPSHFMSWGGFFAFIFDTLGWMSCEGNIQLYLCANPQTDNYFHASIVRCSM